MVAKLENNFNVVVEWMPFYLRPDTPPEGMELPDYIKKSMASGSDNRLKELAALYGLEFVHPGRIINTRLAHESFEYAKEMGKGREFHAAVFTKVYGQGQDVSKWEVLRKTAEEMQLDPEEMQTKVMSGIYTRAVNEKVQTASKIGVTGVPTYVINDQYAIVGAQPYEVFINALDQILKK